MGAGKNAGKSKKINDGLILCFFTLLGLAVGSAACFFFGGSDGWEDAILSFCASPEQTALRMLLATTGFTAAILVLGAASRLRLCIYPAVCFRSMGLGAMICGIVLADGGKGLCFAGLVILPYAVISCVNIAYAGEFSLGMKNSAVCPKGEKIARSLLLHTIKMCVLYIIVSVAACAVFTLMSMAFGRYLL